MGLQLYGSGFEFSTCDPVTIAVFLPGTSGILYEYRKSWHYEHLLQKIVVRPLISS